MAQDAAALEDAEMRQGDGYSETSARHSGHVFAAGRRIDILYLYSFYLISHFLFCPYVYFILPASDTQSSYSDYTSLSNDDHDPRYEHDNSAGTILTTIQTCKRCLTICVRRLRARAVRALGVPGVPPPDLGVEDGPEHEPRGAGAAVRPRQDPDPRPR